MSESNTGTTESRAVGTGLAEIEASWNDPDDNTGAYAEVGTVPVLLGALRAIIDLGDESPIQFVRRHGIDPSAGGAVFLAAARADVLAVLREAGL